MKPREQGGVVDSSLNVYGVEGLKVCGKDESIHLRLSSRSSSPSDDNPIIFFTDLSVAPGNVGAVSAASPIFVDDYTR